MLLQYGIDGQLLNAIKSLYMHSKVCVRVNSATTEPFRVSVGLRQGCFLSPILFLIYMNRIVKKSESCGGVKIGECTVQRLLFAFLTCQFPNMDFVTTICNHTYKSILTCLFRHLPGLLPTPFSTTSISFSVKFVCLCYRYFSAYWRLEIK